MSETELEEGYYWALHCDYNQWEVVEITDDMTVLRTGSDRYFVREEFVKWGPRLSPPGE